MKSDFPLLVFHGGAGPADPQPEYSDRVRSELMTISETLLRPRDSSWSKYLQQSQRTPSHLSSQVVLETVKFLEANPMFNAGRGSALQEDGQIRVSASFMESGRQIFSSLANAQHLLHPSELAHYLQFERFTMRDGLGVERLARSLEIPPSELLTQERLMNWVEFKKRALEGDSDSGRTGTVGAVALSRTGELASCTSTGGVGHEPVGRLGDTPTISGNYCNENCAVSCTGIGEQINHLGVAHSICLLVAEGQPLRSAMNKVLQKATDRGFQLAAIAVAKGREQNTADWCTGATTPSFIWSAITPKETIFFS